MRYKLTAPEKLNARIVLPASKSITNRVLIINALANSPYKPENVSDCDDSNVMTAALGGELPDVVDVGAAGTAMRFMTAYLAVRPGTHVITGTERMKNRPIGILVDALRCLGARIDYMEREGYPPLRIEGGISQGGQLELPGSVSSQYISALLMIGPMLSNGLTLQLKGKIVSRPYIDLTLCIMNEFGASAEWSDVNTITVMATPYVPRTYTIENDWSAASYWYEIMKLSPDVDARLTLCGLMDGSKQGDSTARYLFSLMGVKSTFDTRKQGVPTNINLKKRPMMLPKLNYNFINQPDLAQTFVVTCCAMDIKFHFTGLQSLRIKETDRLAALQNEMRKLGYVINILNDAEIAWDGECCEQDTDSGIDTYEDHRMAMAFAPMALRLPYIIINNPHVVSKSYPHFWDDLRAAGFTVEETTEN